MWPFDKKAEPIPETNPHDRAVIARDRFFKQAKRDPEEAAFHLGYLPADVGHRAMMLIVAELARRSECRNPNKLD